MNEKFPGEREHEEELKIESEAEIALNEQESEENKALEGLKTDIIHTAESKEIQHTANDIEQQRELERLRVRDQMGALKKEVPVKTMSSGINARPDYEQMNEEEIFAAAEVGRNASVQNVQNMITKTGRIPGRFKENNGGKE